MLVIFLGMMVSSHCDILKKANCIVTIDDPFIFPSTLLYVCKKFSNRIMLEHMQVCYLIISGDNL